MATGKVLGNVGLLSLCGAALAVGSFGCDGNKGSKAFSSFELCLLGAPPKDDSDLATRFRAVELSLRKAPGKTTEQDWPNRCAPYANTLFESLGSSSSSTMLRREMSQQLGCVEDQPGSCKFPAEGAALPSPATLWQAAKVEGVEHVTVEGVEAPKATGEPPLTVASWPKLADGGWGLADSHLTARGATWLLFRAPEGRVPVRLCELLATTDAKASFGYATCKTANDAVPKLPLQSVMLVDDDAGATMSGLTEDGRRGFLLDSGKSMAVAGFPGREVTSGLAVERGDNDEGFEAYPMTPDKKGTPIKIQVEKPVVEPMTLGELVIWVEKTDKGEALVAQRAQGSRLVEAARIPGAFGTGDFNVCRTPTGYALTSFGRHKGMQGAKATAGADGTKVTAVFYDAEKDTWSSPVEGKLPFDREVESPLSCSDGSLSLAWAKGRSVAPSAGTLTCTAAGCKALESSWSSVGVLDFAGVAPLAGGKVGVIYRSTLGDLRSLVGDAADLGAATPRSLLDDEAHGGPMIGDPQVLASPGAFVLLFKDEAGMFGLRVGADGDARPLAVK